MDYDYEPDYFDNYDDMENWELDRLAEDAALEREADELLTDEDYCEDDYGGDYYPEDQHLDGMYEE